MKIAESIDMTNMEDESNGEEPRTTLHAQAGMMAPVGFAGCGGMSSEPVAEESTPGSPMLCSGCSKPIFDKYYMWVDKRAFHEACIRCNVCGQTLAESCYLKDCKLYCRQDYKLLQRCKRCTKTISCDELVRRVAGSSFHVTCFACDYCGKQLQSGDLYTTDMICNRICCRKCQDRDDGMFNADDESISGSEKSDDDVFSQSGMHLQQGTPHFQHYSSVTDQSHMGLMGPSSKATGGKTPSSAGSLNMIGGHVSEKARPKRPRTILTTAQRRKFKASFEVSQKPCRKIRESLAAETGLTPRVVQVWFQNQRAKVKKMARRQNQEGGAQDSRRGGNKGRKGKAADSDSENELSSPGSYTSVPTPCPMPVYTDTYRSPGSVHTSPPAVPEHTSSVYFSSQQSLDSGLVFDNFDGSGLPRVDAGNEAFAQLGGAVTTPSSAMEHHFQSSAIDSSSDYNNNTGMIPPDHDSVMTTSPSGPSFNPYGMGQPMTPYLQSQTGLDENPIDRLQYMQDSYFRTWRTSPADCLEN